MLIFQHHLDQVIHIYFLLVSLFQNLDDLPDSFLCPDGREKPWGTGHAILSAKGLIEDPFVVINGDDFYGQESFNVIADYYNNGGNQFSMVAFRLDKTLSSHGAVTRGVCDIKSKKLISVIETEDIEKKEKKILSNRDITFNEISTEESDLEEIFVKLIKKID